MKQEELLTFNRVAKTYVMGDVNVEALKEVDLTVFKGEMLVVLGPSGSGKSTMLNLMGGMDTPTTGDILVQGENLARAGEARLTAYRRREVGFVFQFFNLIPDLNARENVEMAACLADFPLPVEEVLREVKLEERANHFPAQLSGGEQQRVAIARAVVKHPNLLLCDEPTGALDYKTGKTILSLLDRINRTYGSTVIIVTHNTAIGAIADRVVRMRSGRVVEIVPNRERMDPGLIEW